GPVAVLHRVSAELRRHPDHVGESPRAAAHGAERQLSGALRERVVIADRELRAVSHGGAGAEPRDGGGETRGGVLLRDHGAERPVLERLVPRDCERWLTAQRGDRRDGRQHPADLLRWSSRLRRSDRACVREAGARPRPQRCLMRGLDQTRLSIGVVGLGAALLGAASKRSGDSPDFAAMQTRGAHVMGVDQYTSAHVFEDLPDGGRVALERDDAADTVAIAAIRAHLRDIETAFRAGDFTKPFAVHAQTVPGTGVMAARRGAISYDEIDRPRGGE